MYEHEVSEALHMGIDNELHPTSLCCNEQRLQILDAVDSGIRQNGIDLENTDSSQHTPKQIPQVRTRTTTYNEYDNGRYLVTNKQTNLPAEHVKQK